MNFHKHGLRLAIAVAATCALSSGAVAAAQPSAAHPRLSPSTEAAPAANKLIVTEILADNAGDDNFEYFEVYNNSDAEVTLGKEGYSFSYSYTDSPDTEKDVPLTLVEELSVAPGESVVVWLNYSSDAVDTSQYSVDDFRHHHTLPEQVQVARASGQSGLANGGDRGIRVLEQGAVVGWSFYPKGSVGRDSAIEFAVSPSTASGTTPLRTKTTPTPGEVSEDQLQPHDVPGEPTQPDDSLFEGVTSPQEAAPLVISEILPDSKNVGGSDGFEFIEVTNTTDADINFSDYTLNYLYPTDENSNTNSALWPSEKRDIVIPAGKSMVFWIKNGPNDELEIKDFNENFGTTLNAEQLAIIHSGGMANGSARGIQIQTNTGHAINRAYYNLRGASDVQADKGLQYVSTDSDGGLQKLLGSSTPTPGETHPAQHPETPGSLPTDTEAPAIEDKTKSEIDPAGTFSFTAAVRDNLQAKTVTLEVKSNVDEDFRAINLAAAGEDFAWDLPAADITGKKWYEYRFTASDGSNKTTSEIRRVDVKGAQQGPLSLNLQDGAWVNGTTDIIGASESIDKPARLSIDGSPVEAAKSLAAAPTFAMEVTQTDVFFRNGILAGDEELLIFDEGTYSEVETVSTAVPLYHINEDGSVTVSVYAGTKAAPKIDENENNDDFEIRNLRLVLPDGRTLYPAGVDDPSAWMRMGDSEGKLDFFDATFTIPADAYTGVAHAWDTTAIAEGDHTVAVTDGENTLERTVRVDNQGPQLDITGVTEGEELRGRVEINAAATDSGSGVDSVEALLDGERVTLPLSTGSLDLSAGEHNLVVRAEDKVGNRTEKTINFSTPEENPTSGDYSPADGSTVQAGDVELKAKSQDPSGDKVNMTFLKAIRPQLGDGSVRMSSGETEDAAASAADRAAAQALTKEQVKELSTADGLATETSSDSTLPYQLFEVDAPSEVSEGTQLRVNWQGAADSRAQIILYALRADGSGWQEITRHLTGAAEESFELEGMIKAADFVTDGKATLLVQHSEGFAEKDKSSRDSAAPVANPEDVPRSDYDFTLAWESDTQYYNATPTFHKHQSKIHDYVLDQRENKNIKFLFHTGDIVDNAHEPAQWQAADPEYARLDEAGLPYSVLAGNHDVGHKEDDFTQYSKYFGAQRYEDKPWYAESYQDNRAHYDLFSAGGVDFINVAMSWAAGDEEVAWMNKVLAQHPERVAIINLHEFMLTTGGLGPIPQRILDEVVAKNPNVRMVMSGHYHDAFTKTYDFDDNGDGTGDRTVTAMLFDYQALPEGGQGYLRMMHFDNEAKKMMVRTYSPSLDDYNSEEPSLLGPADNPNLYQQFDVSYEQLGIIPETKRTLKTDALGVDFLSDEVIGTQADVASGEFGSTTWKKLSAGRHSWYVRSEDPYGGTSYSPTQTFQIGDKPGGDDKIPGSSGASSFGGALAGIVGAAVGIASAVGLVSWLVQANPDVVKRLREMFRF